MNDEQTIRLDLPAAIRHLGIPGACIQEMFAQLCLPDGERIAYEVRLAASELLTNIIQYGYAGGSGRIAVTLTIAQEPDRFVVETLDQAPSHFDPTTVPEPDVEALSGRGLYLLRQLVDRVTLVDAKGRAWQSREGGPFEPIAGRRASGNRWELVKRLPARDAGR